MKPKSLAALALVLLITGSLVGQDKVKQKVKTFRNSKRFSVNYDKFKDDTGVTVWFGAGDPRGGLIWGAIGFKGETPDGAIDYFFLFDSANSDWRYLKDEDRKLYAIIDGQRLQLGIGERESKVSTTLLTRDVYVRERLVFQLDDKTFGKLANGKSVELKVGRVEFKLKDEHQEAFRDLMSLAIIKD